MLTLVPAFDLIAAGTARLVVGFGAWPERAWGWDVATGVITPITGFAILFGWMANS